MLVRLKYYGERGRSVAVNPNELAMVCERDDYRCVVLTFKCGERIEVEGGLSSVLQLLEGGAS